MEERRQAQQELETVTDQLSHYPVILSGCTHGGRRDMGSKMAVRKAVSRCVAYGGDGGHHDLGR